MTKCLSCNTNTNIIYFIQCSYCKNSYCIKCRSLEVHNCTHLIDCKKQQRSNLEENLLNNISISHKVLKI
jgi:predicted nucleic acid binding AN1-type Zn finger protein